MIPHAIIVVRQLRDTLSRGVGSAPALGMHKTRDEAGVDLVDANIYGKVINYFAKVVVS